MYGEAREAEEEDPEEALAPVGQLKRHTDCGDSCGFEDKSTVQRTRPV